VVIVPGYGMAVAQAQHKVRELYDQLKKKGVDVKFAIHPVAGRMPGHMNVLLAEAEIPYDRPRRDGRHQQRHAAVRRLPGARRQRRREPGGAHDKKSPIFGMPIIDADKARMVYAVKRSKNPGLRGHRQRALLPGQDADALRRREGGGRRAGEEPALNADG
jgi:NAD(P) transhydrogenase subunit beta